MSPPKVYGGYAHACKGDWTWNIMTGNNTRATWNNEKMEEVYAYVN